MHCNKNKIHCAGSCVVGVKKTAPKHASTHAWIHAMQMRFDFFSKAALEFLLRTGRQPDILHCHDWSTAHVAKSYWQDYNAYGLWKAKVVFTIHNMNYGKAKLAEAAYYCQKFTTVSPTYAFEIGGNPVIGAHTHKFMGIRNGIDPDLWDPENNQWLPMPYTAGTVVEGKAAARKVSTMVCLLLAYWLMPCARRHEANFVQEPPAYACYIAMEPPSCLANEAALAMHLCTALPHVFCGQPSPMCPVHSPPPCVLCTALPHPSLMCPVHSPPSCVLSLWSWMPLSSSHGGVISHRACLWLRTVTGTTGAARTVWLG
eukprot:365296-Chlamydomonas_euryale.AAC.29